MTNPTTISTYHMKRVSDWIQEADKFQYDPKGQWPLLQRICFWVLRKLKAHADLRVETISRSDLSLDKLVDAVMRNQLDVELIYNKRAKYIIVGHDAFARLTSSEEAPFFMFDIPPDYRANVGRGNEPMPYFFRGLKVVIVPWVDGLFVLPEIK